MPLCRDCCAAAWTSLCRWQSHHGTTMTTGTSLLLFAAVAASSSTKFLRCRGLASRRRFRPYDDGDAAASSSIQPLCRRVAGLLPCPSGPRASTEVRISILFLFLAKFML